MYKKTYAANKSTKYLIDDAGVQFFTQTSQLCRGSIVNFAHQLKPGQIQQGTLPNIQCDLYYSIVTYNWTHLPSGKGGTVQTDRLPYTKGKEVFTYGWKDAVSLDASLVQDEAMVAPVFEFDKD